MVVNASYFQVISGYQLPKKEGDDLDSIIDPYVKLDLISVSVDEDQSFKTEHLDKHGTEVTSSRRLA